MIKNPFKQKKDMKPNKFDTKRKYSVRAGVPEKTFRRLQDLYELLQCKPDKSGYVVTTFEEMMELTEIDSNSISIMIANGLILKTTTGGSPKYKYKWDTVKPTMDMAMTVINKKLVLKQKAKGIVSESQPESITLEVQNGVIDKEDNQEIIEKSQLSVHDQPDEFDSSIIMDSRIKDGVMIMRVNLDRLGITETDVLNAVLAISANK